MSATQRQARTRSLANCVAALEAPVERMITTQMLAYPDGWSETEKREAAQLHLFGRVDKAMTIKTRIAA